MHKELIRFSLPEWLHTQDVVVYTYAFCVVLGALLACLYIYHQTQKQLQQSLPNSFFYQSFLAGFVGGKLLFYLEKPVYYLNNPSLLLHNFSGGFVLYGSVIFIILYAVFYALKNKIAVYGLLDILSIATIVPITLGRIGCFCNGCCYGKPTQCFLGMVFPNTAPVAVHPTQLYEAFLMIVIVCCLLIMKKYKKINGQIFLLNISLYAIGRVAIEILRGDDRGYVFNNLLSHAQAIAIVALLISCYLYLKLYNNKHHPSLFKNKKLCN